MDLLSYVRVLRRRWLVIFLLIVVGAGLGVASTRLSSDEETKQQTFQKATTTLIINNEAASSETGISTNLDQLALLTTTGPVPDEVAQALGEDDPRSLAEHITTLTNASTNTLQVTAVDPDAARAVELSDTFSSTLLTSITADATDAYNEQQLEARNRVQGLLAQVNDARVRSLADPGNPQLAAELLALQNQFDTAYNEQLQVGSQPAPVAPLVELQEAESIPIGQTEYRNRLNLGRQGLNNLQSGTPEAIAITAASDDTTRLDGPVARGVLGALLGLLAGVALAMLLEKLDRKIRDHDDVEAAFGLPVLADVPKLPSKQQAGHAVVSYTQPLSRTAEAYRAVRSSVLFQMATQRSTFATDILSRGPETPDFDDEHHDPIVIMVTSAAPKEGKTTSSANLAAVFAEAGADVLVVNCDFRRPMIHQYLGVADQPRRVHNSVIPHVKVVTNVVTETDPNPARVVAAQRQLVEAAKQQFDVVLLDTAPLLSANDAVELVGETDLVLMVARADISTSPSARRAMEILGRVDAPVAGVLLVGASEASNDYYGYYYYDQRSSVGKPQSGRQRRKAAKKAKKGASVNGHANGAAPTSESVPMPGDQFEQRADN